ncbi:SNF2 family N-terminal domain [Musa troglodytarum]|uniref:SNF2 family N-terminal domain n=1 Tax=Musa troglodytarum TaxID=320322 RepID=A0A9E7GB19_9LILI|nr:SNF2 family N-terminal domain [Musa troglodytarum]
MHTLVRTVEEQVRAAAEHKLGVANQSITAGFFDNNTRESKKEEAAPVLDNDILAHRYVFLHMLFLNNMLFCSESEIDIFESIDKQRRDEEMAAWQRLNQGSTDGLNPLAMPSRLVTDEDLKPFYKAMMIHESPNVSTKRKNGYLGGLDTQQYGRGKRTREVRSYGDQWTEEEFEKLCQVDSPESSPPTEISRDPCTTKELSEPQISDTQLSLPLQKDSSATPTEPLQQVKEPTPAKRGRVPGVDSSASANTQEESVAGTPALVPAPEPNMSVQAKRRKTQTGEAPRGRGRKQKLATSTGEVNMIVGLHGGNEVGSDKPIVAAMPLERATIDKSSGALNDPSVGYQANRELGLERGDLESDRITTSSQEADNLRSIAPSAEMREVSTVLAAADIKAVPIGTKLSVSMDNMSSVQSKLHDGVKVGMVHAILSGTPATCSPTMPVAFAQDLKENAASQRVPSSAAKSNERHKSADKPDLSHGGIQKAAPDSVGSAEEKLAEGDISLCSTEKIKPDMDVQLSEKRQSADKPGDSSIQSSPTVSIVAIQEMVNPNKPPDAGHDSLNSSASVIAVPLVRVQYFPAKDSSIVPPFVQRGLDKSSVTRKKAAARSGSATAACERRARLAGLKQAEMSNKADCKSKATKAVILRERQNSDSANSPVTSRTLCSFGNKPDETQAACTQSSKVGLVCEKPDANLCNRDFVLSVTEESSDDYGHKTPLVKSENSIECDMHSAVGSLNKDVGNVLRKASVTPAEVSGSSSKQDQCCKELPGDVNTSIEIEPCNSGSNAQNSKLITSLEHPKLPILSSEVDKICGTAEKLGSISDEVASNLVPTGMHLNHAKKLKMSSKVEGMEETVSVSDGPSHLSFGVHLEGEQKAVGVSEKPAHLSSEFEGEKKVLEHHLGAGVGNKEKDDIIVKACELQSHISSQAVEILTDLRQNDQEKQHSECCLETNSSVTLDEIPASSASVFDGKVSCKDTQNVLGAFSEKASDSTVMISSKDPVHLGVTSKEDIPDVSFVNPDYNGVNDHASIVDSLHSSGQMSSHLDSEQFTHTSCEDQAPSEITQVAEMSGQINVGPDVESYNDFNVTCVEDEASTDTENGVILMQSHVDADNVIGDSVDNNSGENQTSCGDKQNQDAFCEINVNPDVTQGKNIESVDIPYMKNDSIPTQSTSGLPIEFEKQPAEEQLIVANDVMVSDSVQQNTDNFGPDSICETYGDIEETILKKHKSVAGVCNVPFPDAYVDVEQKVDLSDNVEASKTYGDTEEIETDLCKMDTTVKAPDLIRNLTDMCNYEDFPDARIDVEQKADLPDNVEASKTYGDTEEIETDLCKMDTTVKAPDLIRNLTDMCNYEDFPDARIDVEQKQIYLIICKSLAPLSTVSDTCSPQIVPEFSGEIKQRAVFVKVTCDTVCNLDLPSEMCDSEHHKATETNNLAGESSIDALNLENPVIESDNRIAESIYVPNVGSVSVVEVRAEVSNVEYVQPTCDSVCNSELLSETCYSEHDEVIESKNITSESSFGQLNNQNPVVETENRSEATHMPIVESTSVVEVRDELGNVEYVQPTCDTRYNSEPPFETCCGEHSEITEAMNITTESSIGELNLQNIVVETESQNDEAIEKPSMESTSVMEVRDEVSNLECIQATCDIVCNPEPSSETCNGEHTEVTENQNAEDIDMPCMESASVMEAQDEVSNLECIQATCDIVCNPEPSSETCHGEHNEVIETKNVTAENTIGELNLQNPPVATENRSSEALDVPNVESTSAVEVGDEVSDMEHVQVSCDTACNQNLHSERCHGEQKETTEAKNVTAENTIGESENPIVQALDVPNVEATFVVEVGDEETTEAKNVTAENTIGESENPIVQALDVPNVEATFVVEVRDEVGNVEYAQPTYDTICNPELSSETCYSEHNELTEAKNITAESSDAELNLQNLVETKNDSTEVIDVPSVESAPVTEVRDELRNVVYAQPTSVSICNPEPTSGTCHGEHNEVTEANNLTTESITSELNLQNPVVETENHHCS